MDADSPVTSTSWPCPSAPRPTVTTSHAQWQLLRRCVHDRTQGYNIETPAALRRALSATWQIRTPYAKLKCSGGR
jgi:hypothetical protein